MVRKILKILNFAETPQMQGEVGTHPGCTNPKIVFDLWFLHDMATFDKVSKNSDSNIPPYYLEPWLETMNKKSYKRKMI